ncbi:MAG: disulfide bond formation protein DsbA, partial [Caulobacteraceae bacterium]
MRKDAPEPARTSGFFSGPRPGQAALAVSAIALVLAAVPYFNGGPFEQRVRGYLLSHPEMLQEMSDALRTQQDNARISTVNERAAANPTLLAVDARDPAFGPADAKVTVIEFFDFRCPGCKATAPEVLRLMQAHPDVRFVFKDWPILDRPGEDASH